MKVNFENTVVKVDFNAYKDKVKTINTMINEKTGLGNDFLGWTTWPNDYDKNEVKRMIQDAKYVREHFDI